jgi:hypothetical protein
LLAPITEYADDQVTRANLERLEAEIVNASNGAVEPSAAGRLPRPLSSGRGEPLELFDRRVARTHREHASRARSGVVCLRYPLPGRRREPAIAMLWSALHRKRRTILRAPAASNRIDCKEFY